jgi:hypothetical protein
MRLTLSVATLLFGLGTAIAQPNYWQQAVEYKMSVDFDVEKHQFEGNTTLKYTNNSPDTLSRAFFHLYFNAFQPNSMMDVRSRTIEDPDRRVRDRISKLSPDEIGYHKVNTLKMNGKDVGFKVESTVLEANLPEVILPGQTVEFEIEYNSQVPVQIRRSGRDNAEGIDYSMSQWFPKIAEYDDRGWHAHPYVGREFYGPWGTYEVDITIDKDYVLAGTGILQNPNETGYGYEDEETKVKRKGKKLTWKFKAENVHDFMWAADRDYVQKTATTNNGTLIRVFYQPDTLVENWEKLPDFAVRSMEYLNDNFGVYPYQEFSIIQGGDGGMEYPMSTLITGHRSLRSLVGVTVHEMLHSWYQGVLATNESYYAWMDEGFTSYATSLTVSYLFNGDNSRALANNYRSYFSLASSGKEEPLSTHADRFETNFAYGLGSYSKGAVAVAQLGYIIGEENLNRGLKRYFNEWKFKHPDLNDFIRVMEKVSGLELDWYFDYWVNTTKTVNYAIDTLMSEGNSTIVKLSKPGKIPMPIDLVVTKTDGSQIMYYIPLGLMRGEKPNDTSMSRTVLSDWYWTHPTYEFTMDIPLDEIERVEIDPSVRMADVELSNNSYRVNQ